MFDLKDLNLKKVRMVLSVILIQLLSFAIGVYSGHNFWPSHASDSPNINNYNTNPIPQKESVKEVKMKPEPDSDCKIKGNISSSNKIYHLQGGAFYDRTTAEMCFNSEEEAKAAGFVKSSK